jgi:hypothetical protein
MSIDYPKPPAYLLAMPKKVLHGQAAGIEAWCKENGKQRPTLLDLEAARRVGRR